MSLAAAMAWNTLLMSVGGMALYNFILVHYGAGRAASSFFLVPGGAALIARFVLDEHLSGSTMLGLAAASVGVALVWWPAGSRTAKAERTGASAATS
jgi:drug/metabolite transporter (DMT)-like permease